MDIQTIWIIVLVISTPIAGVVGFAIQLRTVKKTRLENEKLSLEIQRLNRQENAEAARIVQPSNDEVSRVVHGKSLYQYLNTPMIKLPENHNGDGLESGGECLHELPYFLRPFSKLTPIHTFFLFPMVLLIVVGLVVWFK